MIHFKAFLVDSRDIDSSVAKVAEGDYFIGWLSLDGESTMWRLNLVHLLQNRNSQELFSVPITPEGFCLEVYLD